MKRGILLAVISIVMLASGCNHRIERTPVITITQEPSVQPVTVTTTDPNADLPRCVMILQIKTEALIDLYLSDQDEVFKVIATNAEAKEFVDQISYKTEDGYRSCEEVVGDILVLAGENGCVKKSEPVKYVVSNFCATQAFEDFIIEVLRKTTEDYKDSKNLELDVVVEIANILE